MNRVGLAVVVAALLLAVSSTGLPSVAEADAAHDAGGIMAIYNLAN